ncbi:MAG: DUF1573 domain-containing protein [Pontiellaceae bacterium]|nr:DUF1573 domain-containing protein [Pontiellaceae bacterium]
MKKWFTLVWLAASTAGAGIEWEQVDLVLPVAPTQVSTTAVYKFTNTGDEPITISHVQVTCGCLEPSLSHETYGPGEKGELNILFDLRQYSGPQDRYVIVEMSDGSYQELTMSVDIPKAYIAEPRLIEWDKGDDALQKTIRMTNANTNSIKLLSIKSSNEAALPAQLKTVREGFEYEVIVTRNVPDTRERAIFRIATEPPPGETEARTITFYGIAE